MRKWRHPEGVGHGDGADLRRVHQLSRRHQCAVHDGGGREAQRAEQAQRSTFRELPIDLAWNRMEAEAFWELFKEHEDAGGDGYIHTVVQPAMNLLKVIDIEDAVSVLRLTNNRK